MKKSIILILISVLIASCSSGGKKERANLKSYVRSQKFEKALKFIRQKESYKEDRSRLLALMETGMIYHRMGKYSAALIELEKAKDLSRKLYTESLSKKAQAMIANDNYDIYYGEKYERSMIHFYLSLSHFLLYQRGSTLPYKIFENGKAKTVAARKLNKDELRLELQGARAELLAWDSFLKTIQKERLGKTVYKDDLLAKVYGAQIHEAIGSIGDLNIALQLYKDAKKVLFRNFNSYKSFNNQYEKFIKDFSKLPSMKKAQVEKEYVSPTEFQKSLKDYLDFKILSMTKIIRSNDYKTQVKRQKPTKDVLERLKGKKKISNVTFVLQEGVIPDKVPNKVYFGLAKALSDPNMSSGARAAAQVGHSLLTIFAAKQLGLLPPPRNYSYSKSYVGWNVASAAAAGVAISFEMPKIDNRPLGNDIWLLVKDEKGTVVKKQKIPLINPLGDIAEEAVSEHQGSRFSRLAIRLASKHIAAIGAAYGTYKVVKKNSNAFFARNAAVIQYLASSKLIEQSEKADVRYWGSLPSSIRLVDFYLPQGKYTAEFIKVAKGKAPASLSGIKKLRFEVVAGHKKNMLNIQLF